MTWPPPNTPRVRRALSVWSWTLILQALQVVIGVVLIVVMLVALFGMWVLG